MRAGIAVLLFVGPLVGCDFIFGDAPADEDPMAVEDTPPADELEAALRERAREVAPYMIRAGEAMRGDAERGGARDFSEVLHPGWCYKVIALGDEGVEDLDIRVYNGNDVLIQRDTTRDPRPYIGQMRPICPGESATYRIEVRVVTGSGAFVAQVYRSI